MECESMPCNVYDAVDKLFTDDQNVDPTSFMQKLRELFPHNVRSSWPSIFSSSTLSSSSGPVLVRARCMVQDQLGSEIYAATCEVTKGDSKRVASGVLRDSFGDETLSSTLSFASRHCYVMVPIPGATEWYSNHFDGQSIDDQTDAKRAKLEGAAGGEMMKKMERFVAKFTDDSAEELGVNRVLDVYGVMSEHGFGENPEMEGDNEDTSSPTNFAGVPNLHVIHYEEARDHTNASSSLSPPSIVLPRLRSLLSECVGDELAADYLAMHLMSSTYARADNATICALPLNVCGVKERSGMEQIVTRLAAKVRILPLTSSSLSSSPFHSVKCYKTNLLQQGELQLSNGTHLLIDETVTPKGKVEVSGHAEENLATLHRVISEQKVEYIFGNYRCSFDVDVPVMVLSEERSRFIATPYRIALPAGPAPSAAPIDRVKESDLLEMRRTLIESKRALKDVIVSGEVAKEIQEDFVRMCADPSNKLASDEKADKMSQLLILTRLVTVLRGKSEMTIDAWRIAVEMEKRRETELNTRFPLAPTAADFIAENKEN